MNLTDRAYVAQPGADLPGPFVPAARWITVVATEEAGEEVAGFWATVRANATNATIQAISQPGALWADVAPILAPLVRAWNATREEIRYEEHGAVLGEDGAEIVPARRAAAAVEAVPAPPPSEAGAEAILALPPPVREWLLQQVILAPYQALALNGEDKRDDRGKGSPGPSGATPDGTPGEATPTASPSPSRRSRASSPTP